MLKRMKDATENALNRAGNAVVTAAKSATNTVSEAVGTAVDATTGAVVSTAKSATTAVTDAVDNTVGKINVDVVKTANVILDAADTGAEIYRSVVQIPYVGTMVEIATGEKFHKVVLTAVFDTAAELERGKDGAMPCHTADMIQTATKVARVAINGNTAKTLTDQVEKVVKPKAAKAKKIVQ